MAISYLILFDRSICSAGDLVKNANSLITTAKFNFGRALYQSTLVKNKEQPENPEMSTALLPKSEMSRATKNLVMKKIIIALSFLLPFTLTAQQHSGKISFFYQAGYLSAGYIN